MSTVALPPHPSMPGCLPPPLGGGGLRPLLVPAQERERHLAASASFPHITISARAYGDLVMLGIGGFTPLAGFMGRADWFSVCSRMTLADGTFWPLPVLLDVDESDVKNVGETVALSFQGRRVGVMDVTEIWKLSDEEVWFECEAIFKGKGKDSQQFRQNAYERHPGVQHVMGRRKTLLAGNVSVLDAGDSFGFSKDFMLTPYAFRQLAASRGWREVTCLQLRNPPHRSHEYLARIGLETSDALLIHTPIGALKPGDLPAAIRLRAINALIDNYLPKERTALAGYPLDMRYAGPREALLHAVFRQNYGIATQIVGRDHAGVGDFYEPFESQEIFRAIPVNADSSKNLLTKPLRIRWPFYCKRCGCMASLNTCPHSMEDRIFHSGSLLRKCLAEKSLPPDFIRKEVFDILAEHYSTAQPEEKIRLYGAADGTSLL